MTQTKRNELNAIRREINDLVVNKNYTEKEATNKVLKEHNM